MTKQEATKECKRLAAMLESCEVSQIEAIQSSLSNLLDTCDIRFSTII